MRLKQVVTGVSVVLLGIAVGGVAIAATDRSASTSAYGNLSTQDEAGRPEAAFGHRHRFGPGPGGAIHGEYVVRDGDGYRTLATQRGTAQQVGDDSLRVRSEDGYVRTYVITADTLVNSQRDGIGSVETDDKVAVLATVDGDTVTALRVDDVSAMREHPFLGRDRLRGPGAEGRRTQSG